MFKLMIVDDDILIRESLKFIIEAGDEFEVVGIAENGKDCIVQLEHKQVDLLLLDLRMPVMDGVEVLRYMKMRPIQYGHIRRLVLTTFDEEDLVAAAISNGAAGYLLKNSKPDKIISALHSVVLGNGAFEEQVIHKIGLKTNERKNNLSRYDLSKREIEIVELIAEGRSNKEIAKELYISEGTVKNYITSILTKMDLKHRTQIAIAYLKQ